MARPKKQGLAYFSFDVDFFEDEKIEAVSGEFGIKAEIATIKLLCAIYRNGYFVLWSDMLKMKLLKSLPGVSIELLETLIQRLIAYEFFDKNLFDSSNVLTSKGIQKRFFEATKRRSTEDDFPFLLVNVDNNWVNVYNNSSKAELMYTKTTQSKVKESKEKEITTDVVIPKKNLPSPSPVFDSDGITSVENLVIIAKTDNVWLEQIAINTKMPISVIAAKLDEFQSHLLSQNQKNKARKDFYSHFANWLRKTKTQTQPCQTQTPERKRMMF